MIFREQRLSSTISTISESEVEDRNNNLRENKVTAWVTITVHMRKQLSIRLIGIPGGQVNLPAYRNGRAPIVNTVNSFNCAKHRNAINGLQYIYIYIYMYISTAYISSFITRAPCDLYALCEFTIHGWDNLRRHGDLSRAFLSIPIPESFIAPLDRDYLSAGSVKMSRVAVG